MQLFQKFQLPNKWVFKNSVDSEIIIFFLNTLIFWGRFTHVASAEIAHSVIGLQNYFLMSQMQFYSFAKIKGIKYLQADRKLRLKNSKASF